MDSLILHVDIDAFFASVEQIRNPRLSGKPVAVGSGVIASCSYEAREHGLRAGMPLGKALRRCPNLIIVRGRETIYRAYARRLFDICETLSPRVEEHLDEAYCDLSGTRRIFPNPVNEAERLCREVTESTGLTVTVGLGRNRMFARLIGRDHKPNGIGLIRPEDEEDLLLSMTVGDLPGVGPRTTEKLGRLGIETISQLRQLSAPALKARTLQRGTSFDEDVSCPRTLDAMLEYLTERAASDLRKRGLMAGGVSVQIAYSDHIRDRRRESLKFPSQLDPDLIRIVLRLRRTLQKRRTAIRFIGLILDKIQPVSSAEQGTLFDDTSTVLEDGPPVAIGVEESHFQKRQQLNWQKLLPQVDRVREQHGHGLLLRGSALALQQKKNPDSPGIPRQRQGLILRTSCLTR